MGVLIICSVLVHYSTQSRMKAAILCMKIDYTVWCWRWLSREYSFDLNATIRRRIFRSIEKTYGRSRSASIGGQTIFQLADGKLRKTSSFLSSSVLNSQIGALTLFVNSAQSMFCLNISFKCLPLRRWHMACCMLLNFAWTFRVIWPSSFNEPTRP